MAWNLYCDVNNVVMGWHDSLHDVSEDAYAPITITIIPYDGSISDLPRQGPQPPACIPDIRPYLAPSSMSKNELSAYARIKQKTMTQGATSFDVVKQSFDKLQAVLAGIDKGKITTPKQVDAAWNAA